MTSDTCCEKCRPTTQTGCRFIEGLKPICECHKEEPEVWEERLYKLIEKNFGFIVTQAKRDAMEHEYETLKAFIANERRAAAIEVKDEMAKEIGRIIRGYENIPAKAVLPYVHYELMTLKTKIKSHPTPLPRLTNSDSEV